MLENIFLALEKLNTLDLTINLKQLMGFNKKIIEGSSINTSSYLNLDKVTFERLNKLLDSKKLMYFIKQNGFIGGSFPDKIYQNINKFIFECSLPEFKFIDADLEGI